MDIFWQALGGGSVAAVAVVFLLREWITTRLRQSIAAEYDQKLEGFKREVELEFNDRMRLRKVYEEMSNSLEEIFGNMASQNPRDMQITIHKLFALLALYAPDDVYRRVKNTFYNKERITVYAKDYRPVVYHALRKSLFGDATGLEVTDILDNIEVSPILSESSS